MGRLACRRMLSPAPAAGAALASVSGPPTVAAEVSAAVRHPPVATLAVIQADIDKNCQHGRHADMQIQYARLIPTCCQPLTFILVQRHGDRLRLVLGRLPV